MSNFYVHIIESPAPADLQEGRREGTLISEGLRLIGIFSCCYLAVNKNEFMNSLYTPMADATTKYQKYPILHISAHGDDKGIELTDRSRINWNELKEIIKPINMLLQGQFVICLSSCRGFTGCKMAMEMERDVPFGAIVGPLIDIPWDESAIAFMVFYNRLVKDGNAYTAVWAMNAASGGIKAVNFDTITGVHARASFLRELEKIQFQEFQKQLNKLKSGS